jgi:hypothetical protein
VRLEERDHREHSAMIVVGRGEMQLGQDAADDESAVSLPQDAVPG